jgi:hypothetical protein
LAYRRSQYSVLPGECDAVGEAGDSGFDLADDRDWFRSPNGLGLRHSWVPLSTCWLLPQ